MVLGSGIFMDWWRDDSGSMWYEGSVHGREWVHRSWWYVWWDGGFRGFLEVDDGWVGGKNEKK